MCNHLRLNGKCVTSLFCLFGKVIFHKITVIGLFKFFFFLIFGCTGSSLLHRLSLVGERRGYSRCGVWASRSGGFSCCRAWVPGHVRSAGAALGLQSAGSLAKAHGLSCPVACGIFPDQGLNWCPQHCKAES